VRLAWALVVLAAVGVAGSARADEPATPDPAAEARQQFNLGTAAFKDKKFVEAALHFEAAAAQRAHAVTLYTAALAWEQANKPERACDDFGRALEVAGLTAQQAANARDRVAALEKSLGTVVVMVPEGWRVQLEGLTEVAAPTRLHGSPGVHKLLVRAPGKPPESHEVTLEAGQLTRFELEERSDAKAGSGPPSAPGPERPSGDAGAHPRPTAATKDVVAPTAAFASWRKPAGFAAIGLGVATLGAGVLLGTQALDAKDAYDAAPTQTAYDHARSLQTWTTVAFVAGSLFTAGGVVFVLLPEPKRTAWIVVRPTIGGATLGGAF
jgi:hypothetical protein